MPGIAINEDGSIEYQGKKINKFYIEGMDLLGGKYTQASENIDVDKVKKIQVFERHQPIKALKNTNFSEQAALNIVLGDSAKNVWTHTIDLAVGMAMDRKSDFLYNNRLFLCSSREKCKVSACIKTTTLVRVLDRKCRQWLLI